MPDISTADTALDRMSDKSEIMALLGDATTKWNKYCKDYHVTTFIQNIVSCHIHTAVASIRRSDVS